ncbi:MAG: hypothetical protein FJ011_10635 [Chloroflexi bacterium]|nr:hypothetical protein [Chloroflexota bacterium]
MTTPAPESADVSYRSHLFTLRLWAEALGDGQHTWRGKVTHVLSGETHYFREWRELMGFLWDALQSSRAEAASEE